MIFNNKFSNKKLKGMGCPCLAQNNIIKAKDIDLNEKLKTCNEIYTCVNILTTSENNIPNTNKMPDNYFGKAKQNILKHSKDKKLKEKVKKHISVKSINHLKSNHKVEKEKLNKLEKVKKKYCSGPIISLLESRYKNLSKKKLNINEH